MTKKRINVIPETIRIIVDDLPSYPLLPKGYIERFLKYRESREDKAFNTTNQYNPCFHKREEFFIFQLNLYMWRDEINQVIEDNIFNSSIISITNEISVDILDAYTDSNLQEAYLV